ncbi:NlpC/P60 family protein [Streptomyces asoensis]|uniref:NlpC/P60 family protein n=1 Tax=Streptomyces asoensis TaxID=249586 RepID=UPI0033DDBEE0
MGGPRGEVLAEGESSDRPVSRQDLKVGDLLFWSHGSSGSIYHVALYAGDGNVVQAPRTGRDIELAPPWPPPCPRVTTTAPPGPDRDGLA